MATGTLWNEKTIHSGAPKVNATTTYEYERTGSQLKIKVNTANHCVANGAYWDWRWAFSVTVNGRTIASNVQIKPRTHLNIIGTTVYSASTGWATVDIGTASEVTVSVSFFDTEAGNDSKSRSNMGGGTYTIKGIPSLPSVSLTLDQKTNNSAKISYSVSGSYDYVRVYLDNNKYADVTSSPFTITGLLDSSSHSVYARAYGNGGFGNNSNTLTFTTYLKPVSVGSVSVGNTAPFSLTAYCTSSDASNTSNYEFALCDSNKRVLQGVYKTSNTYYNFTGLQEETNYIVRCRVQSKDSGAWSDYVYSSSFDTPADQARLYVKNGTWHQGKVYFKKNGHWYKVKKVYYKKNGKWVLSSNK